ncbi:2'-5'-RNA ligase [Marinobacter litoralis]|uniref:RNA 2',3'-cyclic phosphodiesterase n=1 Tax=Marinobacter litoralis TaxID=187981 RepID=A0A3M2RK26_9GAMM|nr:RNA 2',3'-cyclic phosphodiesterase [Marinobacter litoralis]RMJ05588.1 2'-5'-RNA ligase [Marinobacter litoralis]
MPKVFFGVEIAPDIKQRLLNVQAPIQCAGWQSSEQLHLTLVFLGNVPEGTVPGLFDSAGSVSAEPFELAVRGLGCFGSPERPSILWAGVCPETPVVSLHRQLLETLVAAGVRVDHHNFKPHITLSRFGRGAGSVQRLMEEKSEESFGTMAVNAFVLYESTQGPNGSVYTVLKRFPLN